jgi:hypothetical protein
MSFYYNTISSINSKEMNIIPHNLLTDVESFGFYSNYYLTRESQHIYYSPGITNDVEDIRVLTNNSWRRLVIRDALCQTNNDIVNIYRAFRSIGEFNNISCLETNDDGIISILFSTWTDNMFTQNLVAELEMCDIHNNYVSSCEKQYVTMFYDAADGKGKNEIRVSLSWKNNIFD